MRTRSSYFKSKGIIGLCMLTFGQFSFGNEIELAAKIAKTVENLSRETRVLVPNSQAARSLEANTTHIAVQSSHYDLLSPPPIDSKIAFTDDATLIKKINVDLADILHETWQAKNKHRIERFKPMKVDGSTVKDQAT